jgi:methionyl-tRNA synthetase
MSFYVTTPIYYVNAAPHLGHAYTTIGADILARHMRQRGEEVFFLTGTDEHGEPVALAAEREGVTPQELADRNAERFRAMMPALGASNDFFIRTSDPEHVKKVQEILTTVKDNGHVYKGLYEGWYCPRCADFKSENEIGPGNTCPIHEIELIREREENYFFALSTFQEPLERLYAESRSETESRSEINRSETDRSERGQGRPDFVLPPHHFNEARSFIAQGLQDVSLTRAKLTWGVPVPWDAGHVFYVWFDALLNYVTALSYARPGEDLTDRFWPASFHIIGKDILKFHTVFWPALLMAAGLELPRHVFVHGFLLMDDRKMSKSLGNVLDPFAIIDRYGSDALRYYCFREVSFGRDGSVSAAGFEARYETELANEYGNLASRTIAMVHRYRDGTVPAAELDGELAGDFEGLPDEVCALLDRAEITQALEAIWQRVRRLNRYVEEQAPWTLAKREGEAGQAEGGVEAGDESKPGEPSRPAGDELDRVLASLIEGLRVVTVLLGPYLPTSTAKLLDALKVDGRSIAAAAWSSPEGGGGRIARSERPQRDARVERLEPDAQVERLEPLFPKLQPTAEVEAGS